MAVSGCAWESPTPRRRRLIARPKLVLRLSIRSCSLTLGNCAPFTSYYGYCGAKFRNPAFSRSGTEHLQECNLECESFLDVPAEIVPQLFKFADTLQYLRRGKMFCQS